MEKFQITMFFVERGSIVISIKTFEWHDKKFKEHFKTMPIYIFNVKLGLNIKGYILN